MNQNEKKDKSKIISTIALITFFISTIILFFKMYFITNEGDSFVLTLLIISIYNSILINRYIGLVLAIFSYIKYKTTYSKVIMILCIILQIISLFLCYIAASGNLPIE